MGADVPARQPRRPAPGTPTSEWTTVVRRRNRAGRRLRAAAPEANDAAMPDAPALSPVEQDTTPVAKAMEGEADKTDDGVAPAIPPTMAVGPEQGLPNVPAVSWDSDDSAAPVAPPALQDDAGQAASPRALTPADLIAALEPSGPAIGETWNMDPADDADPEPTPSMVVEPPSTPRSRPLSIFQARAAGRSTGKRRRVCSMPPIREKRTGQDSPSSPRC